MGSVRDHMPLTCGHVAAEYGGTATIDGRTLLACTDCWRALHEMFGKVVHG